MEHHNYVVVFNAASRSKALQSIRIGTAMNPHRQRVYDLLSRINARQIETDNTAQGYNNGGPNEERMYNMYINRAQGQRDIYQMVEQFIADLDAVDGWPN